MRKADEESDAQASGGDNSKNPLAVIRDAPVPAYAGAAREPTVVITMRRHTSPSVGRCGKARPRIAVVGDDGKAIAPPAIPAIRDTRNVRSTPRRNHLKRTKP